MRNFKVVLLLSIVLAGCGESHDLQPNNGIWRAELKVAPGHVLPFNFKLKKSESDVYSMEIYNAEEVIQVDEIVVQNDSIIIKTPVFEGYISASFTANAMHGKFIKESLDRVVPFSAIYGKETRFEVQDTSHFNLSGVWETNFNSGTDEAYIAKGIFAQQGDRITGTFETTTGDYRFLEGVVDGDSLKISTFDGAHAFLFAAKASDSTLNGIYYSGNHSQEPFVGRRNHQFELPDPDSLTFLKAGFDRFDFNFEAYDGALVSLSDPAYRDKVVLVQIMGTWCPNCLDETKFYVDYLNRNKNTDLAVVALAFEYAKTRQKAFERIDRLKVRIGVEYPILLAQFGTSDKLEAQKKLPMLNHILSYPTTIFIDKKGVVRKIHTGFNGPATGAKFITFKAEFNTFVQQLLEE